MNGRANRRRGHDAERAVAAWLRAHGYPEAHTTRSALGHDGTRQPGDVVGPVLLVVSVKDRAGSAWPTWEREAQAEAGGRAWVVVRRVRGFPDVGQWTCRWGGPGTEAIDIAAPAPFSTFLELFDDGFSGAMAS